jgi:hypothetical protein
VVPVSLADREYLAALRHDLDVYGWVASVRRAARLIRIVEALSDAVDAEGSLPGSLCNEIIKWRKERM